MDSIIIGVVALIIFMVSAIFLGRLSTRDDSRFLRLKVVLCGCVALLNLVAAFGVIFKAGTINGTGFLKGEEFLKADTLYIAATVFQADERTIAELYDEEGNVFFYKLSAIPPRGIFFFVERDGAKLRFKKLAEPYSKESRDRIGNFRKKNGREGFRKDKIARSYASDFFIGELLAVDFL